MQPPGRPPVRPVPGLSPTAGEQLGLRGEVLLPWGEGWSTGLGRAELRALGVCAWRQTTSGFSCACACVCVCCPPGAGRPRLWVLRPRSAAVGDRSLPSYSQVRAACTHHRLCSRGVRETAIQQKAVAWKGLLLKSGSRDSWGLGTAPGGRGLAQGQFGSHKSSRMQWGMACQPLFLLGWC